MHATELRATPCKKGLQEGDYLTELCPKVLLQEHPIQPPKGGPGALGSSKEANIVNDAGSGQGENMHTKANSGKESGMDSGNSRDMDIDLVLNI